MLKQLANRNVHALLLLVLGGFRLSSRPLGLGCCLHLSLQLLLLLQLFVQGQCNLLVLAQRLQLAV